MSKSIELLAKHLNEEKHNTAVAKNLQFTHALARMKNVSLDAVIKAMDTAEAGAGLEWQATGFSPDIVQEVALDRKVASLFERLPMPNNPYKFPVEGGDPTAYITAENTADSGQTSLTFSNAGTAATTFDAVKLSVGIRTSDELNQDSIASVAPYINRKAAKGLANGEEAALINGDTSVTHQDSDSHAGASTLAVKAFKGLRALTPSSTKIDGSAQDNLTAAVRAVKARMGKFGVNPSDLVVITGTSGYYKLMSEGSVITADKFGPQATILTGELGKFDGSPVVVSAYVREDLDETGVYDTSDQGKTQILVVNRKAFAIGDRLSVEFEADREAIYGQDLLIARERIDFQPWYGASATAVGMVYNIAKL